MLRSRPVPLTRRSAVRLLLAGAVGAALLTACDLDDLTRGTSSAGAPGHDGGAAGKGPDPDLATVALVVTDVRARLAALVEARARFTRLREPLRALEDMHRAHLDVLAPTGSSSATSAPRSPAATVSPAPAGGGGPAAATRTTSRLLAAETAHHQTLVTAAEGVASGALARLLASMSASVTQHLAVLPDLSGGTT